MTGDDILLQSVVSTVRAVFDSAACSIAVVLPTDDLLEFRAAAGAGAEHLVGTRLPVDRGLVGYVLASGQAIAVADVGHDPRFARDVAEATGFVPRSIVAAPMFQHDAAIGVLSVLDAGAGAPPSASSLALLGRFADHAALLVTDHRSTGLADEIAALVEAGDGADVLARAVLRSVREFVESRDRR